MEKETPILYFNASEEDIETFRLIKKSGIECKFRAAASDGLGLDETPTRPLMTIGYQHFVGIEEIRDYINKELN